MRYCLIAIRAKSHSVSCPARLAPFRVVKNGFNLSVKREMNRLGLPTGQSAVVLPSWW